MKKKKKTLAYSRESIIVLVIFLLLAAFLWIQKSGERYTVATSKNTYLKGNIPTSKTVLKAWQKKILSFMMRAMIPVDERKNNSRRFLKT